MYVLTQNKRKKTYELIFKKLHEKVDKYEPKYINTDFEIGAINAAKKYFIQSNYHGCYFHLGQCVWRHVQELGMQMKYVNDVEFALNVRQILALAFVPSEDIPIKFDEMCKFDFWKYNEKNEFNNEKQQLINYFEDTYIGGVTRNRRRHVEFPPSMWSVYDLTKKGVMLLLYVKKYNKTLMNM